MRPSQSREDAVRIIAGLGNPGAAYKRTRHNAGWMALDKIADRLGPGTEALRCGGIVGERGELCLFKPLSYMNLCGPPVAWLCGDYGVALADLLVLVDDLNLPLGRIRLRPGGSSGGHNGLESLIEALGTEEFPRLRMGTGPCPPGVEGRAFVLSPFAPEELDAVERMTDLAAEAALCWTRDGIEAAMSRFNAAEPDQ